MPLKKLDLHTLGNGQLENEFQEALQKVYQALTDDDLHGICKVSIDLTFVRPSEKANFVESTCTVKTTVPSRKSSTVMIIRDDHLMMDDTSSDASQPGLFPARVVKGDFK